MKIAIIAAISSNGVIGDGEKLLWDLPNDMAFFRLMTSGSCVMMGRKTYESIPEKFRPLPDRSNIVLSKTLPMGYHESEINGRGYHVVHDIENALEVVHGMNLKPNEEVFVCGGGEIYKQFLDRADRMYITEVNTIIKGNTKFPEFSMDDFSLTWHAFAPQDEKNEHDHHFYRYDRKKK